MVMLGYMTEGSKRERMSAVPAFFQEHSVQAMRQQAAWLIDRIGVDDAFFARLTRSTSEDFSRWRRGLVDVPTVEVVLRDLWRTVLHLLSLLNFDSGQVAELFESVASGQAQSTSAAPWQGSTLRRYLETGGAEAIAKVESWVTGLKFGDPAAA
jgi:hypothetical protein